MKKLTNLVLVLILTSASSVSFANAQASSSVSLLCSYFGFGCAADTTMGGRSGKIVVDD